MTDTLQSARCDLCMQEERVLVPYVHGGVCVRCVRNLTELAVSTPGTPDNFLSAAMPGNLREKSLAEIIMAGGEGKPNANSITLNELMIRVVVAVRPDPPKTGPSEEEAAAIREIETALAKQRARAYGLDFIDLDQVNFECLAIHGQTHERLVRLRALPVAHFAGSKEGEVVVAVADPWLDDLVLLQAEIKEYAKCEIVGLIVSPEFQIMAKLLEMKEEPSG